MTYFDNVVSFNCIRNVTLHIYIYIYSGEIIPPHVTYLRIIPEGQYHSAITNWFTINLPPLHNQTIQLQLPTTVPFLSVPAV